MKTVDIIKKPIISEKSFVAKEKGKYVFMVDSSNNKQQLKQAIQDIFKVDVEKIWTMNLLGKAKRTGKRRQLKQAMPWKKAIVKLRDDQKIEVFEEKGK